MTNNSMTETTRIEGKYTDAVVYLPEDEIEVNAYEQIQMMVNHPAFRNQVRVMPDTHYGAGAVIGFTMPMSNRVSPNTVGVDIGCGMYAFKIADTNIDPEDKEELALIDEQIRDAVPMGQNVVSDNVYHVKNDFLWDELNENWRRFSTTHLDDIELGRFDPDSFEFDIDYFKKLCRKVSVDMNRTIASIGSLGGGNHFIELSTDSEGNIWCIIHSGSRGIGYSIGNYHQERAESICNMKVVRRALESLDDEHKEFVRPDLSAVSDEDLHEWVHNKQIVDYKSLKDEFKESDNPSRIEEISDVINKASRLELSAIEDELHGVDIEELMNMNEFNELAYLEGHEAVEYYVDMAFAQMYASESRKKIGRAVADAVGGRIEDPIESVHNYIDYEDGILRKGATPARKGQRAVIPMNMSYGTLLVTGKGNVEWNNSAPHGAGRKMSRTQAESDLSKREHAEQMGDTFASELPLDEAPMAYKDVKMIEDSIGPTVNLEDVLTPFLNLKAGD